MLSPQTLDRLGALNREPLPTPLVVPPPRLLPTTTHELPSGEAASTSWGPYWRIEAPVDQLWPTSRNCLPMLEDGFRLSSQSEDAHDELRQLAASYPAGALYLDLETCGWAGAMVFLVGLLSHDGQSWRLTQLLARDYSEEKAVLQALWSIAGDKRVLVTFNGKTFDWPLVHDRSTVHHLGRRQRAMAITAEPTAMPDRLERHDDRPEIAHCDILHHARRKWRGRLPNCRLQTLERLVCGRRRIADIAGRDIPAAYHRYVRTKDAWEMRSILHHNALDLVTLLEVSLRAAVDKSAVANALRGVRASREDVA